MLRRLGHRASETAPYTRKIGIRMIIFGWIALMGLLAVLFGNVLESRHNPNHAVDTESTGDARIVSLKQNRMGHYVVNGKINRRKVEFLVDTGATTLSVPMHIADRLSLKKGPSRIYSTANGNVMNYETTLDSVQLGDILLNDVRASINPYMGDNTVLLGMSFLRNLELKQKDGILTLIQN